MRTLAIVDAGPLGLAHCAAKLTVTVMGTASPIQTTVTVVNSGVATSLYTVTATTTASTETLLFTESATTTASTLTDVATTTTTITVPSTEVSFAPEVTSTKTVYQQEVTARSLQTDVPEVPRYASGACDADFFKYAKACACAGVKVITVTAESSVKTVTIEAGTVTSIYSTYFSTETSANLATVTTSTTLTTVISVTDTVTSTTTETASSTIVVSETVTPPTSVVTLTCKPPGSQFHARVIQSDDGSTRHLNDVYGYPAWQIGFLPGSSPNSMTDSNSWVISSSGYLEGALPITNGGEVDVPYVDVSVAVPTTVQMRSKPKGEVEAAVLAGTYVRVKACINAETNELTLSVEGRHNIFNCLNILYMSMGDASELPGGYKCVRLFPVAIPRTY